MSVLVTFLALESDLRYRPNTPVAERYLAGGFRPDYSGRARIMQVPKDTMHWAKALANTLYLRERLVVEEMAQ
jgi:hypothetical protein